MLLDQGEGKVLLFQLNGAMIFVVAKAIAREHNAITDCKSIVFDLGSVSHLDVTAALALENAVEEAVEQGHNVSVVGAHRTHHPSMVPAPPDVEVDGYLPHRDQPPRGTAGGRRPAPRRRLIQASRPNRRCCRPRRGW